MSAFISTLTTLPTTFASLGFLSLFVFFLAIVFSDVFEYDEEQKYTHSNGLKYDPDRVDNVSMFVDTYVDGNEESEKPVKRALVIGINYYGTSAALQGCINDAINTREMLRSKYGFEEILMITDETLLKPTRHNMMLAFDWLVEGVSKGDCLYLHYSGHGSQAFDASGDEKDGRDETVVPVDYLVSKQITDDELYSRLVKPLENTGARLFAVLDCCHSGSGMDLNMRYIVDKSARQITTEQGPDTRKSDNVDAVFFSGCSDSQTSADVVENQVAFGAFTNAFLSTLRVAWQRPQMTYRQFLLGVNRVIDARNHLQQPQMCTAHLIDLDSPFRLLSSEMDGR